MEGRTKAIIAEITSKTGIIDACEKGEIKINYAGSNLDVFIGQRKVLNLKKFDKCDILKTT